MSNWKKFNYSGWFSVNARNMEEAQRQVGRRIDYELGSTEDIVEVKPLGGVWKSYSFKGWFEVSARSPEEALKRAAVFISQHNGQLVSDDEIGIMPGHRSDSDRAEYLTNEPKGRKTAYHFSMSNGSHTEIHDIHAASARDAWEALRGNFIHGEHIILSQHVLIPVSISPKWRVFDTQRDEKTPRHLGHQIVIACGLAEESWWSMHKDTIKVNEESQLIEATELPLSY